MKILDDKPLLVTGVLKKAYSIRSKYSHGDKIIFNGTEIRGVKISNLATLSQMTLNYARLSLLVFLQINSHKTKKELLNLIDDALLDDESYLGLKKLLKENLKLFD